MRKKHNKRRRFIVTVGSVSYGDPFLSFARVTNRIQVLIKERERVLAVLFTGGEDVSPSLYGGIDDRLSVASPRRDELEKKIFSYCKKNGIRMMGICRGIQFLNVMSGGKMYQHVESHVGTQHSIFYPALKERHFVNSLHHQMVKLPKNAIPVALSKPGLCDWCFDENGKMSDPPSEEIEAAIFPESNAIGVQFHPEIMGSGERGRIFFINMMKDFLKYEMKDLISKYGYVGAKDGERSLFSSKPE